MNDLDPAWLDELGDWLRIPSVSADPAHEADVRAAGQWVCDFVTAAGGGCALVETDTHPLAVGEIRASQRAEAAPTVLLYGHFDVQSPGDLALWDSPPFEPEIRDGWLYGRGTVDDKGNLYLLLKAAALARRRGRAARERPDRLRRRGGDRWPLGRRLPGRGRARRGRLPRLRQRDAGDRRAGLRHRDARHLLFPRHGPHGRAGPALGHLRRGGAERDPCPDRVAGCGDGRPAGAARRRGRALGRGARLLEGTDPGRRGARPGGRGPARRSAGAELYLRTGCGPAVDVNGIAAGSPDLHKTIIPAEARANVSIRLAPGQSAEQIAEAFERILRGAAPAGTTLEVERWASSEPGLVPADSAAVRLARDAFERVIGRRPLLVRSGGSIPMIPALLQKGIPTVLTGFAVPGNNLHSPNERLLARYLPLGVEAARETLVAFQELSSS